MSERIKCIKDRCYSPVACGGFGYCREMNMTEPLALQAAREDERLACWKIAEEERKTAAVDKPAWLVAFDIANAIKMRGHTSPLSRPQGETI